MNKHDEIVLPEIDRDEDFIFLPTGKYEMLIRDSEKIAALMRYLDTSKPNMDGVRVMMEVK